MRREVLLYIVAIALINSNYYPLASGQDSKAQCAWSDCGAESCDDEAYPYKWATGTCEESFLCLSGSSPRLYCCEVPSPYIETYWIGTPPLCGVSCDDCKVNDECILSQDPCGDGSLCVSGSKTLCGQLHPAEQLKKIPWYYWLIGAALLIAVGIGGISGVACCVGCNCCS